MPTNVIPISSGGRSFFKKLLLYPFLLLLIVIVVALLIGLPNIFYSVEVDQEAVVMRFGEFNRFEYPGLHTKVPFGIEQVILVPVKKVHVLEFGFRTLRAGIDTQYSDRCTTCKAESVMLTGDLNVANVEWAIHYKITNAKDYLFSVRNVDKNLEDISQAVMREVVGDRSITEVINIGRTEIAAEARDKMQKIIEKYKMGVMLDKFYLQNVTPPDEVKPSFNEVNSSSQEANQVINEAMTQYNNVIPKAKGRKDQTIANAKAYKTDIVNRAIGDSKRFTAFYEEYKKAPEITRQRLYFDKLKGIFKKAKTVYVVDPAVKGIVPLMNLTGGTP